MQRSAAQERQRKKNTVLILIAMLLLAAILCLYVDAKESEQEEEAKAFYDDLAARVVSDRGSGAGTPSPSDGSASNGDGTQAQDGSDGSAEGMEITGAGKKAKSAVDFDQLQAQNGDVVAWIVSEGTAINYPVVHGSDNKYYLTHSFDRTSRKQGAIFVDARNSPGFADANTLLYGHHMRSGAMFASIVEYKKQGYYDEHPTMLLYTPEQDYRIDLFAGYVMDLSEEDFVRRFSSDDAATAYLDKIRRRSTFDCNVHVSTGDRIVTLITCSYEYNNGRYALVGKLVPV